jgi:hypothetical protein
VACSGFVAETPPTWARRGMAVSCDDSGKWAYTDLAIATAGGFALANAEGKGIDIYAATATVLIFGASSIIGFRRTRDCRCLHEAWREQARLR